MRLSVCRQTVRNKKIFLTSQTSAYSSVWASSSAIRKYFLLHKHKKYYFDEFLLGFLLPLPPRLPRRRVGFAGFLLKILPNMPGFLELERFFLVEIFSETLRIAFLINPSRLNFSGSGSGSGSIAVRSSFRISRTSRNSLRLIHASVAA